MVQLTCIDCGTKKTIKPSCLKNGLKNYRCRSCSNKIYRPKRQQDISSLKKIKLLALLYKKCKNDVTKDGL